MGKRAVLLLAHGTPDTVEEIPEYLRNVVSGRPMPQAVVEEIQHRYSLIGHSPLTELTFAQGKLLEDLLTADLLRSESPESSVKVYVGMRNWRPYIPEVVKQMRVDGVTEAAVICLAPQNSRTSTGLYKRAVEAEVGEIKIDFTAAWADHPLLADAFAERLRVTLAKLTAEVREPVPVLFTAHSVPCRTLAATETESGDTYATDARKTAELVAARVPELKKWYFAFQSQGASGGEWIGPKVESTLDALAAEGVKTIILQPIGFLCDHVEILYDIDIAFRDYAKNVGIRLERPESLNASPILARALGDLALAGIARLEAKS
jgi:ferrochelatase